MSVKIIELVFYHDQKNWNQKVTPIEISKNNSDKVIDKLIYKKHYVLIKKTHIFLSNHDPKFVCKRCLSPYSSQIILMKFKVIWEQQKVTSTRTSNQSHPYWRKHFQKNPLYFRLYAAFEAGNEIDFSSIGNKASNI